MSLLPPTPDAEVNVHAQQAPRVPPRFVPTLTEVLPAPPAPGGAQAPGYLPPVETPVPVWAGAAAPIDAPIYAPIEAPTKAPTPPQAAGPAVDLALLQDHIRQRVISELTTALPDWVDEALAPRLELAVAEATADLRGRLTQLVEQQVAAALRESAAGGSGSPADGAA